MRHYLEFPWCLHKDHEDGWYWDITRMSDPFRVFLQPCGGVSTEAIR